MNGNVELLNYIYQNSQMGTETISHLLSMVEENEFKNQLQSQCDEYQLIHKEAKKALNEHGFDEKGITAFEKIKTYLMIDMQTLADKSSSHIAEMLVIGSNMGIINAIKNIKKYKNADSPILNLMEKLKSFEEKNVSALKQYL